MRSDGGFGCINFLRFMYQILIANVSKKMIQKSQIDIDTVKFILYNNDTSDILILIQKTGIKIIRRFNNYGKG